MDAERLKARGLDVVDFGPGEPDFPTPEHIKQGAIEALAKNYTKYTPTAGIAPLRHAICKWHAEQLGSAYEPGECVVTVGGKHAIYNAVISLIQKGDEVLIPAPYWVSFPDIVRLAGGEPVFVPTEASSGFILRADAGGSGHHPAHAHVDRQFAEQSHRRCNSAQGVRAHLRSVRASQRLADDRRVLLALHLRGGPALQHCQRAGFQAQPHRYRLALQNICHDRLARGLRPGAQAAD